MSLVARAEASRSSSTRCVLAVATLLGPAVAVAGCAASPMERPDEPLITEPLPSHRATDRPSTPPLLARAAVRRCPALPTGAAAALPRADLDNVLRASPGAFLSQVNLTPEHDGSRFIGWRVESFFDGDRRFDGAPLCIGDVVTRINEHSVERPEQFMELWQSLAAATSLRVALLRDGKPAMLTFPIEAPAR